MNKTAGSHKTILIIYFYMDNQIIWKENQDLFIKRKDSAGLWSIIDSNKSIIF